MSFLAEHYMQKHKKLKAHLQGSQPATSLNDRCIWISGPHTAVIKSDKGRKAKGTSKYKLWFKFPSL